MKKIISFILVSVIVASMGVLLAGCNNNKTEATQATEAATAAQTATQASTQSATQTAPTAAAAATQAVTDGGDTYAGLTQDEALDMAVARYAGYYANSIYQGADAAGNKAWVIEMTDTVSDSFTAYVTKDSVTSSRDSQGSTSGGDADPDSYAGISEQDAIQKAVDGMGEGWSSSYVSKGQYQGVDCWVVTVVNEDGYSRKAYVTFDACYYG